MTSIDVCTNKFLCRSEYDTLGTSVKAALVYLGTALVKVGPTTDYT